MIAMISSSTHCVVVTAFRVHLAEFLAQIVQNGVETLLRIIGEDEDCRLPGAPDAA
jgi:hypothetical protein